MKLSRDEQGLGHILVAVLIIVMIGAIGFAGWRVYQNQNSKSTNPNAPQQSNNSSAATTAKGASDVVANIKSALSTKFKVVASSDSGPSAPGIITIDTYAYAPYWEVGDQSYFVTPETGVGLRVNYYPGENDNLLQSNADRTTLINTVESRFKAGGLNKVTDASKILAQDTDVWASSSVVCSVDTGPIEPIGISCGQLADYQTALTTIKPLASAYLASSSSPSTPVGFDTPTVKNSKTPGYKTATMGITGGVGGAAGLFYSVHDTWHYLTSTQAELSCSTYTKNNDARLAFLGTSCTDDTTGQNSTVQ